MTNKESPFADRSMIKQRDRFFGRKAEKIAIFNALAAPKPQCVSIIGDKRIGRSSLLWHIQQVYREMLPNPQRYHFAYLDLSRDACTTPDQFYAEVAQAFLNQKYDHLTPHEFDDLMADQRTADQKFILLLDEFNILQRRKRAFNDDFYDGLRARANAGELAYVLASHLPLEEVAVENDFTSTFFGIFTPVSLGEFTPDEAHQSFLRPATPQLSQADFEEASRWFHSKYHPLKLNIAANLIWLDSPSPNYASLKQKYDVQVDHVFGATVRGERRRQNRKGIPGRLWRRAVGYLEWWTQDNRWIPFAILMLLMLFVLGYISWNSLKQLLEIFTP